MKKIIAIIMLLAVNGFATTYYVATTGNDTNTGLSWAAAKATIQGAADVVSDTDAILVSNGTYNVTNQISIANSVTVQGVNGSDVTIIDGGDVTRCVYGSGRSVILDGFTVRNGRSLNGGGAYFAWTGTIYNCSFTNNYATNWGGGIYFSKISVISNSVVSDNRVKLYDGGGVYGGKTLDLDDSVFSNNISGRYGGGVYTFQGGEVNDCDFLDNTSTNDGGGLFMYSTSIVISNSTFVGNYSFNRGGGAGIRTGTSTLYNCTFSTNTALNYGGGLYSQAPGQTCCSFFFGNVAETYDGGAFYTTVSHCIKNSVMEGNEAKRWGGAISGSAGMDIQSSTISGNYADSVAGGVYVSSGNIHSTNNIIYFNDSPTGSNFYGNISNEYTCTTPLPATGTGNISDDPLFVDAGSGYGTNHVYGDLKLLANSPAIDVGTNQAWMTGAFDIIGRPRIYNSIVDMGAYEYFVLVIPEYNFVLTSSGFLIVDDNGNALVEPWVAPVVPPAFPDGLVFHWNFDETNNLGNVLDVSTNATYNGEPKPTFATGPSIIVTNTITAGNFDGSDDRYIIPDADALSPTTNGITLCGWVNYDSATSGSWPIGYHSFITKSEPTYREYSLKAKNERWFFSMGKNPGGLIGRQTDATLTGITNYTWAFIAATWDGGTTASSLRIYINGTRKDTSDLYSDTFTLTNTTTRVSIGYFENFNLYPFNGMMDNIQIYNRLLTTNELIQIMNDTRGSK